MKVLLFSTLVTILVLGGCNTRTNELEQQNAQLQARSDSLAQDLSTRDAYIENVTTSINTVYDNLEAARSKEKLLLKETNEMETRKKLSREEIRVKLSDRIATIDSALRQNRITISDLQKKVASYRSRYAGLKSMVESLKKSLGEREQEIAELQQRVQGLEGQVAEGKRMLADRESVITQQHGVIDNQTRKINTGYYIIGKRDELEKKGILAKDGGFLWGLLGSTTVLASGFSENDFTPIDKTQERTIEVKGKIGDIVPKRSQAFYSTMVDGDQSKLTIAQPDNFWQEKYLVIITN